MTGIVAKAAGGLAAAGTGLLGLVAVGMQALAPAILTPTAAAVSDIPTAYLALYQAAAGRCPMPWTTLAGVGRIESDHGRDAATSVTGAIGPMQFEPATWQRWGVDGDGDGRKDTRDPADAIPAAADYLCALGVTHNAHDALVAYNCGNTGATCQTASAGYAAAVLATAASYGITEGESPVAEAAVRAALEEIGTPYLWGGEGAGGFDCSGLVQFAYARAGLALPRTAQDQYDATVHLTDPTSLLPGDLVFFGSGPRGVEHVGIALGDGRMVDAPHTGAVVRVEAVDLSPGWFVGATRPVAS
ncbi:MAG TPA: bifunctional lytic transglycosylase/C40 family peptidase [Mycobacteriales bacterium]|nr:bifunctional lytic transglycosylase/C40 family peptidase [Mycobacteriales bacterium]